MTYEWNEKKRESNIIDRGLDFLLAPLIYEYQDKLTIRSQYEDETRWIDMAEVDNRVLVMVYTMRDDAVRVISLRHASRKERRLYHGG